MTTAPNSQGNELQARRQTGGRIGFAMGCVAAVVAVAINFYRAPRPITAGIGALIVLIAALNIPLGIAVGLLGERLTRRSSG
jgi:tetrahydromethanopterin S-methyltransferase subunit C